jgi:hypothetical protein
MATKTLSAELKIGAKDQTGSVFAQVARNLRDVERRAADASRRMDGITSRMSSIGRVNLQNIEARARIAQMGGGRLQQTAAAAATTMRGMDIAHLSSIAASVIGSAAVFAATKTLTERLIASGAEREGEKLSRKIAGITPAEEKLIVGAGAEISDKHRSISRADVEAMLRDARTIVGSTEGALAIGDTLAQLRVILQRLEPGGDINKQLNDFTRVADLSGATSDPETFKKFANSYAKVQGAFPGVISPLELVEYAKKSHGAAAKYSPEFSSGVLPSLIQSSGGATTGEMLASFARNIVDERIDKQAKKKLAEYGLMKGGHIIQRDLAASDPYLWTRKVLVPSLEKHGVKDVGKQSQIAGSLFSDATAAEVTKRFVEQWQSIERDRQKSREAMDLGQVKEIEKSDLGTAMKSVSSQATNASSALGTQFVPSIVAASNAAANFMSIAGKQLEASPTLRNATVAGGLATGITVGGAALGATLGGLGGVGVGAGAAAGLGLVSTPLLAALPLGAAGYKGYEAFRSVKGAAELPPQNWFEEKAAAFDKWVGIGQKNKSWSEVAAGLRAGGTIEAKAKLEGSADIGLRIAVYPSPDFMVKVDQRIEARGALRTGGANVGTTMPLDE